MGDWCFAPRAVPSSYIALGAFLGAVGLILPAATGILTWLTPLAAALLALMMLLSIGFHVACRDTLNIVVGLVLFALAAFVAYGRWVIAPFWAQSLPSLLGRTIA
jgi:hypothetical protein